MLSLISCTEALLNCTMVQKVTLQVSKKSSGKAKEKTPKKGTKISQNEEATMTKGQQQKGRLSMLALLYS